MSAKNIKRYMVPEVSAHFGEVAYVGGNTIYMRALVEKLSDSVCNIHGIISFAVMGGASSSEFNLISKPKMCSVLGLNSLNIDAGAIGANLVNIPAATSGARGYGMKLVESGTGYQIARYYNASGANGGWASNNAAFAAGNYAVFDIYGASYT